MKYQLNWIDYLEVPAVLWNELLLYLSTRMPYVSLRYLSIYSESRKSAKIVTGPSCTINRLEFLNSSKLIGKYSPRFCYQFSPVAFQQTSKQRVIVLCWTMNLIYKWEVCHYEYLHVWQVGRKTQFERFS